MTLEDLELSNRAWNVIKSTNIKTVGELLCLTIGAKDRDLAKVLNGKSSRVRGIGKKTAEEINELMREIVLNHRCFQERGNGQP